MLTLVAGSSGLIGRALVPELRAAGHDVRRLVRREPAADDEIGWDPPSGSIASGAFDGVDAVINLCGAPVQGKWTAEQKQRMRDSRIEPARTLAEAVAEHGVPTLINASSVSFYGNVGDTAADESSGPGGGFLAQMVIDWETATKAAQDAGGRVALLRTGLVLTPDTGLIGVLRPMVRLGLGGRFGDGRQYIAWISVDDEVAAMRFVLEHPDLSGPINLCAPEPVTNAAFTRTVGRALGRPAFLPMPKAVVRFALGEAADELALNSLRVVPQVLNDAGFTFRHTELDHALADIL
ncbi:TIGR01777 family oxidoreductase [Nonomuraea diastatica]|uniref:TIGR01777 family protein n=1 Tax=Nonomuraea diastatica TaxID=1848329 RepID=A0A4R4WQS4_9ACTN|nr:TIGR01777 family oxidoreductase [Nonomuraea diastatica]TDD17250.1 TIGR01777 family protein [Nonomuraea diastatica]